jgi:hypothetical protein
MASLVYCLIYIQDISLNISVLLDIKSICDMISPHMCFS